MVDLIATLIALVVYCGLSWLVTVGVIKLITHRADPGAGQKRIQEQKQQ